MVIETLGEKIQLSLDKLDDQYDSLEDHEKRIDKLEDSSPTNF